MTAPINTESSAGSKINYPRNQMNMPHKSVLAFGMCATLAILCSGCAAPASRQMGFSDINTFRVDCSKRDEQIVMLDSMRSTRDDRALAKLKNIFQPWLQFTDPDQYSDNYYQGVGMTDSFIDHKIQKLINYCPTKKS
jgi:hypothetical protein